MSPEDEAKAQDQRHLSRLLQLELDRAERAYDQAINQLWLANGAAALATVAFIGATAEESRASLCPLVLFSLGLVTMGVGAIMNLLELSRIIEDFLEADSWFDLKGRTIRSPAESVGLSLRSRPTRMAILSGICFVAGIVSGFVVLLW